MALAILDVRFEQLLALCEVTRVASRARITSHLEHEHAELVALLEDDDLAELVDEGITRAWAHGFVGEPEQAWFVLAMLRVSVRFDEQPAIAAALADRTLAGMERVEQVLLATSDSDWADAEAL